MKAGRSLWLPALVTMALLGAYLVTASPKGFAMAAESTSATGRDIVVSGQAVLPSELAAVLDLTVETKAAEGGTAQADNARAVGRVEASLKGLGVSRTDITEGPYRLVPLKTADGSQFLATETLRVTVGGKAQVGEIVDAAMRAGATAASGVSLVPRPVEPGKMKELLQMATADARTKARAVAESFGVRLGAPERISVVNEGPRAGSGGRVGWGLTVEVTYQF